MKKRLPLIVLSTVNTLVLFFLTFYFWSLPWLAGDEKLMIWSTSAIKVGMREAPESKDYALINVSYDLKLIDRYDEFGFPVGNQAITDRAKLARLFRIINQSKKQPKYILCDIFFEKMSADDSLLSKEMSQMDNLVLSSHLDESQGFRNPVLEGHKLGLSDYVIGNIFEGVYKYQLYWKDSLKLTPLVMAEDILDMESRVKGPLVKVGDNWTLNHFIINYRLLQKDIGYQEAGFNPVNLGELLLLPDEDVAAFVDNKVVILGDFFEYDMHETIFEIMSGPIILLNAYLNIINRDTYVNFWFFLILSLAYGFLSYLAVSPNDVIEKYIRKKYERFKWVKNITSFMSYMIILILVSILLFFIFNIHLNVFFIAIYLFLVEKVLGMIYKRIGMLR